MLKNNYNLKMILLLLMWFIPFSLGTTIIYLYWVFRCDELISMGFSVLLFGAIVSLIGIVTFHNKIKNITENKVRKKMKIIYMLMLLNSPIAFSYLLIGLVLSDQWRFEIINNSDISIDSIKVKPHMYKVLKPKKSLRLMLNMPGDIAWDYWVKIYSNDRDTSIHINCTNSKLIISNSLELELQ